MNIQDIADFIDLVKNPVKYEKVLQNIKDEQDRLNAVIATVGEAAQLGTLRKEVEAKGVALESEYTKKTEGLDKTYASKLKKIEKLQADLEGKVLEAQQTVNDALVKQTAAEELAASFAGRDKKLAQREQEINDLRASLQAEVVEYNEKLTKLRSVMV